MRRGHTVLLVEDNPDDVELTRMAFEKHNIVKDLIVARDGGEALDYLFASGPHLGREAGFLPDVVMLDLNLPKLRGLEVLRRIRSDVRTVLLPVIILTTSAEDSDVINSYGLGANSYVRKPVDFVQFSEAVLQFGLYWLQLNEPHYQNLPGGRATSLERK
jgi:two-component system response regulator